MANRHRFHGDVARFGSVTKVVSDRFGKCVRYIADVAGGQGMLTRQLNKQGYEAEVIDPRGWTLVGVPSRQEEYKADMADYYDLVVGLHPDEALREIVASASLRPTLVIPCCNFWDRDTKLGRDELLNEIEIFYRQHKVTYERVTFDFSGPKNIGFVTYMS